MLSVAVPPAAAQPTAAPSGSAIVAAWRSRQTDAARGVARVEADETLSRRIDGPRGTVRLETRGTLALGRDAQRTVTSARVDGAPVAAERVAALEARLGRAFGPGFEDASRGPRLVPPALAFGTPSRVAPDAVDGRPAWRVTLALPAERGDGPPRRAHRRGGRPRRGAPDGPPPGGRPPGDRPPDRAEAWFSRSPDAPRLLRLDVTGERPGGGRFRRTVDFAALGALDVPTVATAELRVSQRRRLRAYTTSIAVEARYGSYRVVRR